jgi:HAMP domain-containing protein
MPLLGGVRPPVAALVMLLLTVAGLAAYALTGIHAQQVPQAVADEEQQIAADSAATVRVSITAEASTIRHATAAYTVTKATQPATALHAVLASRPSVVGAGLFDASTGRLLAASGETVPMAGLDTAALSAAANTTTASPRLGTGLGGPRILYFGRFSLPPASQDANADQSADQLAQQNHYWLLIATEAVPTPPVHGTGRSAWLLDRDGTPLATAGATGGDQSLQRPAAGAAASSGWHTDASGSLLGKISGTKRTVGGWGAVGQPVAGASAKDDTSALGLTVLTSQLAPMTGTSADYAPTAVLAGGVLAAIALLSGLLLIFLVQRPLLRLHLSAARLARGAAEPFPRLSEDLGRPVPVPLFGEPRRVGKTLEALRLQLRGDAEPGPVPVGRGPGVRALVTVCVVLIAVWSTPLIFILNQVDTGAVIPAAVVDDQQARTQDAADRIRQSLDQSYTDLADVAAVLSGKTAAQQRQTLTRTRADHPQFRSLYVLDSSGAIALQVGKKPLRTLVHVPDGKGITGVNTSGKIPDIAAYAHIPAPKVKTATASPGVAVFGEVDVNALNTLLSRPHLGSVWLTDSQDRVLGASVGYQAFQALPSAALTQLANRTQGAPGTPGSPTSAIVSLSSGMHVAGAAPLALAGPAAGLGWRVVTSEQAAALNLTPFTAERVTMLAGLLGLTAGAACLGWLHIVVVRPLRALARLAERLAGGDRRTVLYPVNHDETGSVTRSLELIRQTLAERARGQAPPGAARSAARPEQPRPENAPQR